MKQALIKATVTIIFHIKIIQVSKVFTLERVSCACCLPKTRSESVTGFNLVPVLNTLASALDMPIREEGFLAAN